MISRVKQAVKMRLEERKIAEYDAWLDELYVSYHDWITQREEAYRESKQEIQSGLLVCMPDRDADGQAVEEALEADVLVFSTSANWLDEYAKAVIGSYFAENSECVLAYGDEDEWNSDRSVRMNPWFKPDFSPDTLLQYFYYGNVIAVRRDAFEEIYSDAENAANEDKGKGFMWAIKEWQSLLDDESRVKWLYRLSLKLSFPVNGERIGHIPYVLYHTPDLQKLCMGSEYDDCRNLYIDRLQNKTVEDGKVSIVIPSKDHPEILETCLKSLVETIDDCNYEIIVVDNGSSEENRIKYDKMKVKHGFNYIFRPMEFHFSKMCNNDL